MRINYPHSYLQKPLKNMSRPLPPRRLTLLPLFSIGRLVRMKLPRAGVAAPCTMLSQSM